MTAEGQIPKTKVQDPIDWTQVERVLIVKLRSIGDTVLCTPSLIALRRFLPHAQIDILLEDWVAPVLDGFDAIDNVITVGNGAVERLRVARQLRSERYDVAFNLHGGTTATWFVRASGARHRAGFSYYQYSFLYNHLAPSPVEFWGTEKVHSAEQQLALLGSAGVPVGDRPRSRLAVSEKGRTARVSEWRERGNYALLHPGTAFFTKQWAPEKFARAAEFLAGRGLRVVAVSSTTESAILQTLVEHSRTPIQTFDDLTLPEITALASSACIFVGNDSGMAHIAAAVGCPSVVIFGSSNRVHWSPWTDAPNEMVFEEFACQPCPGYTCEVYGEPRCIQSVAAERVIEAIERMIGPLERG